MSKVTTPQDTRQHQLIGMLGRLTGAGTASATLCAQYSIPNSVLKAANHHGIWDVTAILPYLTSITTAD